MKSISKGSKLNLYNNEYLVVDSNKKFTILKDKLGSPLALPTEKLSSILNKSENAPAAPAAPSAPAMPSGKMHGGKIRVDKVDSQGRKYHYWVNAVSGVKHDDHTSDKPSEHQIDEASHKLHKEVLSVINTKAKEEDRPKLKKLLDEWVESKAAHHNLLEAHKQLSKESKGVTTSTLNNLSTKQSEHEKKYESLKNAMIRSIKGKNG